jgi:membrane protein
VVVWHLLRETFREWREDRASLQGAALAFYALFSFAPLALVATFVVGAVFGQDAAEERLAFELRALMTPEAAQAVQVLVRDAASSRSGWAASGLGVVFSLYGLARGFLHLQATLNQVWGVRAIRGPGLLEIVRRKLLAFASVALCGSLILVSVIANIAMHPFAVAATRELEGPLWIARRAEDLSSFVLVSVLLMVVYKTLPDVRIRWRDVLVGAGVSATLFVIGKHAIAWYLRNVGVSSSFGAASTLVAVLMYVQYIAQVLLFGAEFTFVYARWRGKPIEPGPNAARVVRTTVRDDPSPDPAP